MAPMPHPTSQRGGIALIALGNLIIVAVLTMQYVQPQPYTMFVTLLVAGGVVAYSGFWALDPKRTKEATQNLADVAGKAGDVVVKVRGRRKTDAQVVSVETAPASAGKPPTTTVTVGQPGATDPAVPTRTVPVAPATPPTTGLVVDDLPGQHVPGEGD